MFLIRDYKSLIFKLEIDSSVSVHDFFGEGDLKESLVFSDTILSREMTDVTGFLSRYDRKKRIMTLCYCADGQ